MSEIEPQELVESLIIETLESDEADGLDSFDLGVLIAKVLKDARWLRSAGQQYHAAYPYKCYNYKCEYEDQRRFATQDEIKTHKILDHDHRLKSEFRALVCYHLTCECGELVIGRGYWDDNKTNDEYFQEHIDKMAVERERLS